MTALDTTDLGPAVAPVATAAAGLRRFFETLRRHVARMQRDAAHRATVRALARLEPHLLADIGVTAADVRREMRAAGVTI